MLSADFERGQKNEFQFQDVDVGEIQSIIISHDNWGMGPGWHLQMVVPLPLCLPTSCSQD